MASVQVDESPQTPKIGEVATAAATTSDAKPSPAFTVRPHQIGDLGWIIEAQAVIYHKEYGWNTGFEGLVAKAGSELLLEFNPDRERFWVVELPAGGKRVAAVAVRNDGDNVARLRFLFVDQSARGLGIGKMLVRKSITFAMEAGYDRLRLWTNDTLKEAVRLYEGLGFSLISEETHTLFGPVCKGQIWELDLKKSSA